MKKAKKNNKKKKGEGSMGELMGLSGMRRGAGAARRYSAQPGLHSFPREAKTFLMRRSRC